MNRTLNLEDAVLARNHAHKLAAEYESLDETITNQLNRIIASSDAPRSLQITVPNPTPDQSDIIDRYTTKTLPL